MFTRQVFLAALAFTLALAACQTPPPAVVSATFIAGRYAYLGYGEKLKVMDVSNPEAPVQIAEAGEAQKLIGKVQVVGSRLYTTEWDYNSAFKFLIYDVSDSAQPQLLSATPLSNFYSTSFLVDGSYAYINIAPEVLVLDVSNPASPKEVGRVQAQVGQRLFKLGETVYTAFSYCGHRAACLARFNTLDVSDPKQPRLASEYDPQLRYFELALQSLSADRLAYVNAAPAGAGYSLQVYDWRDAAAPKLINTFDAPGAVRLVAGQRFLLEKIEAATASLVVAHLTDAGGLEALRAVPLPEQAYISEIAASGDYAYVVLTRFSNEPYVQENRLFVIDLR